MEIYLVRHSPVNNPEKLCYGQSHIELADDCETDFFTLQKRFGSDFSNAVFYSSPYQRCTQLASFLSDNNFQVDTRLSEMNFGDWEQCKWTEIDQLVLNEWMADFVTYKVPGGESFEIMHQRCTQFWEELINSDLSDKVVAITHAGVIRSLLARILDIPLKKIFQLEINFCSVTKITVVKQQGCYQTVNYINR